MIKMNSINVNKIKVPERFGTFFWTFLRDN